MLLGETFPNFKAKTTIGDIDFYQWLGDSWGILFSHPADFTPVCTTELGKVATLVDEFTKRKTKLIALSVDDLQSHVDWIKDIKSYCVDIKGDFPYPIIADDKRELAVKFGMLDPDEKNAKGLALTARAVFIIGPDKKMKLSLLYPATTGRNFVEVLRVLDSLQLTSVKKVATPANWTPGDPVMVVPSLSSQEAKEMFPNHTVVNMPSGKEYVRITKL